MGGAVSRISANISANINSSETGVCAVENVCQGVQVDDVTLSGLKLDCTDVNIGTNSSTSSFTCSMNQSAMSTANVVQNMMASATASWGDVSDSNVNENVATSISTHLQQQCGGVSQAVGGDPSSGSTPNGGACHSGIVQNSTLKNISIEDSTIDCSVLNIGVNNANTSVQCALQQASTADTSITQVGKSIAKDANIIMEIIIGVFAVALLLIIGPFIVGGIIKAVHNYEAMSKNKAHVSTMKDQLQASQRELQLVQLQGATFMERKKLEHAGMKSENIGFHKAPTPAAAPP